VILIDAHPRHDWLVKAVDKRLREELAKLGLFHDYWVTRSWSGPKVAPAR
jgi:hypothetical protein